MTTYGGRTVTLLTGGAPSSGALPASLPSYRERVFVMQPAQDSVELPAGLSGFNPRQLPQGFGGGYGSWRGATGKQMGSLLTSGVDAAPLPSGLSGFNPRQLPQGFGGGYGSWQGAGGQQMGSLILRGGRGGLSSGVGLGLMI